jgi:hypothetical protein
MSKLLKRIETAELFDEKAYDKERMMKMYWSVSSTSVHLGVCFHELL